MVRPRIRTVLIASNLLLLALPLTGIWVLHIYESALIRQTESELLAQAAVLAASYRSLWLAEGGAAFLAAMPNVATDPPIAGSGGRRLWPPLQAALDLADDPVLPTPEDA